MPICTFYNRGYCKFGGIVSPLRAKTLILIWSQIYQITAETSMLVIGTGHRTPVIPLRRFRIPVILGNCLLQKVMAVLQVLLRVYLT